MLESCLVASGHVCWRKKVAVEHIVKTFTDCQLVYAFCSLVGGNNSPIRETGNCVRKIKAVNKTTLACYLLL